MAKRLDDLAIDQIEQARARRRAERRELLTESGVAAVVGVLAIVMALSAGSVPLGRLAWLGGLLAVLALIRFEIGFGNTRPVHLAITPLLVLLPAGLVPLAVIAAYLPSTLARIVRERAPWSNLVLQVADSAFILAPALVFVVLAPAGVW